MNRIEIETRVGPDGVLRVEIPLGMAEAGRKVLMTVEIPEDAARRKGLEQKGWERFVDENAGTITDPTFKRHEQGEFEKRDEL